MDDKYIEDLFSDDDIMISTDRGKKAQDSLPSAPAPRTRKSSDAVFSKSDIDELVKEHSENPSLKGIAPASASKPAPSAPSETGSIIAPRNNTAGGRPAAPTAQRRPSPERAVRRPARGMQTERPAQAPEDRRIPSAKSNMADGEAIKPQRPGARPTARRTPGTLGASSTQSDKSPMQDPAASANKNSRKPVPVKSGSSETPENLPEKAKKAKKQKDNPEKTEKGGSISTLAKAIIYMAGVVAAAIVISTVGIKFANDCFAFVKDDYETTVSLTDGATVSEVADTLYENDIIAQPSAFRLWVGYKYRSSDLEFEGGDYVLNSNLNYDQIIAKIRKDKTPVREIVTISFPEGSTVDDIINTLVEKGIGTREGYVDAINNYDYDYKFIERLKKEKLSDKRKYRLEGYLFPDTYEFYTDSNEVAIIDRFLSNFEKMFTEADYSRLNELDYSLDEIITVASIVQKESKYASEFYTTASVFFNRLKSSDFPKLESDATVQYCLKEHAEKITAELRATDSEYNTYLYNGLPPSAICNPGIDAITAALYPEETGYYYFYAGEDGFNIFSKTYSEHLKVVAAGGKK